MQKRAPSLGNIIVIILFVLSCFGLLLFMWESFGGSAPLQAKGYRFTATFSRSLSLAEQSDVRISGVTIGHVISLKVGKARRTKATIEIQPRYAPLKTNDRVLVRQKTILGETYLEIIPGKGHAPPLRNDGQLAKTNVEPFVTLEDIFSTFTPKVRKAFKTWMISQAASFKGRGEELNLSFATLRPFIEETNKLLRMLAAQEPAVQAVIRNTGEVFDALTERQGQLQKLIVGGNSAFAPAAKASREWAEAFKWLPGFEHNSEGALRSLNRLAVAGSPLLDQLRPAERNLTTLLGKARTFSPSFDALLTALGPLTKAGDRGLPDLVKSLKLTTPLLEALRPVLHNFNPFLQYTDEYLPSVESFFANFAAATEGHTLDSNQPESETEFKPHYLRALQSVNAESLAVYPERIGANRANAYSHPGGLEKLGSLPVFNASNCADSAPSIEDAPNQYVSQAIIEQLIELKVVNPPGSTSNSVPAPGCIQQGPFTFNGKTSLFPHVTRSE